MSRFSPNALSIGSLAVEICGDLAATLVVPAGQDCTVTGKVTGAARCAKRVGTATLLALATAAVAFGQFGFEDTRFERWTTFASDETTVPNPDDAVSGVRVGSEEAAYYLVKHMYPAVDRDPNAPPSCCVSSFSFAPPVDVSALGENGPYRFALEIQFDYDATSSPLFPNDLTWAPALLQSGTVFRPSSTFDTGIRPSSDGLRELVFEGTSWYVCDAGVCIEEAPDLSPGAPPIRLGVWLSTRLLPNPAAVEGRIRLDDFVVEGGGELPPLTVSFVDLCPPTAGSETGLPRVLEITFKQGPELPAKTRTSFRIGLNRRPAVGEDPSVRVLGWSTEGARVEFDGRREVAVEHEGELRSDTLELAAPSDGLSLGDPSRAEVQAILDLDQSCAVRGHEEFDLACPASSSTTARLRASKAGAFGVGDEAALRGFRQARMSATSTGRYYRDLYETTSPDLVLAMASSASLIHAISDAGPPWVVALDAAASGDGDQAVITQEMVDDMLGIFDTFEATGDERVQRTFRFERQRLRLEDLPGMTIEQAIDLVEERGGPPPCEKTATSLCLASGRFRVEVTWRDFEGRTGTGQARALTPNTGTFWFFDPANTELILKVLDATGVNGRFWVFYGALSNVEYEITVTDTATGAVRNYRNPPGTFASFGDTEAF